MMPMGERKSRRSNIFISLYRRTENDTRHFVPRMTIENTIHALQYNTNVIITYVYRRLMRNPTGVRQRKNVVYNIIPLLQSTNKSEKASGEQKTKKKKNLQTAYKVNITAILG